MSLWDSFKKKVEDVADDVTFWNNKPKAAPATISRSKPVVDVRPDPLAGRPKQIQAYSPNPAQQLPDELFKKPTAPAPQVIKPAPLKKPETVLDPTEMIRKIRNPKGGKLVGNKKLQDQLIKQAIPKPRGTGEKIDDIAGAMGDAVMKVGIQPFITRPAAEIVSTIRDISNGGKDATYHPGTAAERYVFGSENADSIQKKTKDQYKRDKSGKGAEDPKLFSTQGAREVLALPLAGAEAGVSILNDAPVVGGAIRLGTKGVKATMPAVKEAAKVIKEAVPAVKGQVAEAINGGRDKIEELLTDSVERRLFGHNVPQPAQATAGGSVRIVDEAPQSVIQSVNPTTGEKKFFTPEHSEYNALKTQIDDARDGTATAGVRREDGSVLHVTARTPEQMSARGFTQVDNVDDLATKPVPTMANQGSTKSISSLMPDLTKRVKVTEDTDDALAKVHGIDKKTIQTLRAGYGDETTNIILARTSDATNISNKDGFVISEARKNYGQPKGTVRVSQGMSDEELASLDATQAKVPDWVGTAKDEAFDGTRQPTLKDEFVQPTADELVSKPEPVYKQKTTLSEKFDNAPEPTAALPNEARDFIGDVTETARRGTEAIDDYLQKQGSSYAEFSREIHEANRHGVAPSEQTQMLYNKFIKPSLDRAREFGGTKADGEQKWYLPQQRPIQNASQQNFGGTLVNELDIGDTGFTQKRTNAIPVDELDHSPEAMVSYYTKNASLPYKDHLAANQIIEDVQLQNVDRVSAGRTPRPVPTPEEALHIVGETKKLGKTIITKANNGGVWTSGAENLDLVHEINKIGKLKNTPQFTVDQGTSWLGRQFRSSDELYKAEYVDGDGIIRTLGEGTGFTRYNNADAVGYSMQESAYKNGVLDEAVVRQQLGEHFADSGLSTPQINQILDSTIYFLNRTDNAEAFKVLNGKAPTDPATLAMDRAYSFAHAEKQVAREQMSNFLEGASFKSPQLKKNINQDAVKMLVQDKAMTSLAEKIVNGATGMVYRGALGYNPISALQNVTELRRAYSEFGEKGFAIAAAKAVKDPRITQRYGIKEIHAGDITNDKKIEVVTKKDLLKPMGAFNATEELKDAVLLHGLEAKHSAAGLTGTQLTEAVMKDFNNLGFKGGKGGSLGFNKSKGGRILGQFMQYSIKDWKLTGSKISDAVGRSGVDEASQKAAQAYLARKLPADVATYLVLNAAYGATWQTVMNFQNPFGHQFLDKDAGWDEQAVSKVAGIGGPLPGVFGDMYLAIRKAYRDAEANGETVDLDDVVNNQLKRDAALLVPGGNQIFNKTGGFITDQNRGYNESQDGRARFASSDDPLNIIRGLVNGRYSTDNAREYFGTKGVAGDLPNLGGDPQYPVGANYQKKIDAAVGNKDEINRVIDSSREQQNVRKQFFKENPALEAVYKTMNKTTYNPTTKKNEADVITPEKWKLVQGDTSGKLFGFMQQKAQANNKEFGAPIDPIYTLSDKARINEVLNLRAAYTGDDRERKATLRKDQWYVDFEKQMTDYYDSKPATSSGDSEFGSTKRAQEYFDLSQNNPAFTAPKSEILTTYEAIRETGDEATRKAFYAANAAALGAEYDARSDAQLEWTNKMRKIEGATPITKEVWDNATYGYNDDEMSVAKRIAAKNNAYVKSLGGSGNGGSVGIRNADFGQARAADIGSVKIKGNTVKVARKKKQIAKVKIKHSRS